VVVDEGGVAAEEVEVGVAAEAEVAAEGVAEVGAVEDGAAVAEGEAADRGDLKILREGWKRNRKGKCEERSMKMISSMKPKARNWRKLEKSTARTKMKIKNRIKMTVKTMMRTKKMAKRQRLSWYANLANKSAS
jgi:hypothetical protein